ncbi:Rossmann-fold NAD(P)-binding domain-containing protein [Sandarakinorhabdus rubra]|uniref:SDR family NAD(P)-dependent oxidoreductase n=1 Tax=Sandarakinorhabdus rubra TaxID=2672568 RepID=UPI0013D98C0E|nr:SDR family NAD(P)-dependent oxidoreductase [Sandarakinorhabdus rubra]
MHLLVLGLGYSAARIAARARAAGFAVTAVRSRPGPGVLTLDDPALPGVIASASHILSSVPPAPEGHDPVLVAHGPAIAAAPARWVGYLSSTGVYGDAGGAWVDESAARNGRRDGRMAADAAWEALHPEVRVFRLPGIYGPGRSALDRLRAGPVARIDKPGHVFSRIHVDDIARAVLASMGGGPPGIYNIADDLPAPGEAVTAAAARLQGLEVPPLVPLDAAGLSPMGRAFYGECRRVANGRMKRLLGLSLLYPDYHAGLAACLEEMDR